MVTLLGREGTSTADRKPGEKPRPSRAKAPETTVPERKAAPVEKEFLSRDRTLKEPAFDVDSMAQASAGAPSQHGQQAGPLSEGAGNDNADQPAGTPSGAVSSEQWAVIVSSIERVKTYPRLARERGIEGVVRLRFRLKPEGEVDRVEIVKSSGHDILDSASVKTLYRAGPMPYVSGWVEVPIAYVLK
jgi:protein TonB